MAFESQLQAQREQRQARYMVTGGAFFMNVRKRNIGGAKKRSEDTLMVRIPVPVMKEARLDGKNLDVFWDHAEHKGMIAESAAGIKWATPGTGQTMYARYTFARGVTPDFGDGGYVVDSYEIKKRGAAGDDMCIVFGFPPGLMISGRNEPKPDQKLTKGQSIELEWAKKETERIAQGKQFAVELAHVKAQERENAPPVTTQKYIAPSASERLIQTNGSRTRRQFSDSEKKEAVRAHLQWMTIRGSNFEEACREVDVASSVMRRWREEFLKAVEREESRGTAAKAKPNGAAARR